LLEAAIIRLSVATEWPTRTRGNFGDGPTEYYGELLAKYTALKDMDDDLWERLQRPEYGRLQDYEDERNLYFERIFKKAADKQAEE
jgi:hypothetical protein